MIYNRVCMIFTCQSIHTTNQIDVHYIVRDSSAVRRLFVRPAGAVLPQGALHKENSGSAHFHVSWLSILFSIQNPYIYRFTNNCSIHSWSSYPQKVVLHSITARSSLRPYYFAISLSFSNICHMTSRKLQLPQCIMGDDLHIWSYLVQNERGRNVTHALSEARGQHCQWIFSFQHTLYYFLLLWFELFVLHWLQNTLYIIFHVIFMLLTHANNLARCIK